MERMMNQRRSLPNRKQLPTLSMLRRWRLALLLLFLPECFFLFVSVPASMAVQRTTDMAGDKPSARLIIRAADLYKTPMDRF
jgi:hypothetical protein